MRLALAFVLAVSLAAAQDDVLRHYHAAQAFGQKGDAAQATAEYKLFLGEALRRLGNAQAQLLDSRAGGELYEEAASFAPDDPALLSDRAAALLRQGKLSQSRPLAERSLAIEPSPRNQLLLGRILFQQGNYAAARPHLEAAIVASRVHADAVLLARHGAALRAAWVDKAGAIERFKSENAVLRNSMAFLPTAAHEAQESIEAGAGPDRKSVV